MQGDGLPYYFDSLMGPIGVTDFLFVKFFSYCKDNSDNFQDLYM